MPRDAEFFSVIVDTVWGLYIRPRGDDDVIYCMKPEFSVLAQLILADTSCLVIVVRLPLLVWQSAHRLVRPHSTRLCGTSLTSKQKIRYIVKNKNQGKYAINDAVIQCKRDEFLGNAGREKHAGSCHLRRDSIILTLLG